MIDEDDIIYRLSYRVGQLRGRGWPFNWLMRKDITLHREAVREIDRVRKQLLAARGDAA